MDDLERARWECEMLSNAICPVCQMAHRPVSETERCSEAVRAEFARGMQGVTAEEQAVHYARLHATRKESP